ncbi:3-dehydroquinate dehydratase I [Lachnospiraceae bacterium KM106-2]|nr:3-dehydroquinate dehydratase I [Lachnospiraceae bacterium KM106-2]
MIEKEEFMKAIPKICVPIIEKTLDGIVKQACSINETCCDVVEWRVDYYEGVFQTEEVLDSLSVLKDVLEKPILFTFRTKEEGGEKAISKEEYRQLLFKVIESQLVDLIDVEVYFDEELLQQIIASAHQRGVLVIGSNHEFAKTPNKEEIISRIEYMKEMGVDIPKIAVMPQDKKDVLELITASVEIREKEKDLPFITMSMSNLGMISRYACEFDGSVMTFASYGKQSAPGQIPLEQLKRIIDEIHKVS